MYVSVLFGAQNEETSFCGFLRSSKLSLEILKASGSWKAALHVQGVLTGQAVAPHVAH